MNTFGIRFEVRNDAQFNCLRKLFYKLKADKDNNSFDPSEWPDLVPDEVKTRFVWPSQEDRQEWLEVRDSTPIVYAGPSDDLGAQWDFYRVFESIEEGEYALVSCEMVDENLAEIHIDPEAYPYGGLGPFIALAEAFGCYLLGLNEYGKYLTRQELLALRS